MNTTELLATQFETLGEATTQFGQCVFKDGSVDFDEIHLNMIRLFNAHNGGGDSIHSSAFVARGYDLIGTDQINQWGIDRGFISVGPSTFLLLNENQYPIAHLRILNGEFGFLGPIELVKEFTRFAVKSFKPKVFEEDTLTAIELTGFNDRGPTFKQSTMKRIHPIHEEYYPFLDGGIKALIHDFIMSDEAVMILGGVPGTGKSVGMRETMIELGLQPIMAQDAQAIKHPAFVNTIFSVYESMYKQNVEKDKGTHYDTNWIETPETIIEELMPINQSNRGKVSIDDDHRMIISMSLLGSRTPAEEPGFKIPKIEVTQGDNPTIPIIFVEDAGDILMSMDDGNQVMQNLRNRTDGIIKERPVKIIFTTNKETSEGFDTALTRDGRCYGFFAFPKLTPEQAIAARKKAGLPDFEEVPTGDVALATALREPRKKIFLAEGKGRFFVQ